MHTCMHVHIVVDIDVQMHACVVALVYAYICMFIAPVVAFPSGGASICICFSCCVDLSLYAYISTKEFFNQHLYIERFMYMHIHIYIYMYIWFRGLGAHSGSR